MMEPLKPSQLPRATAPGLSTGSVCRDLWQDVQGLHVSASVLPLLRVQPILGRAFGAEDDTPGAPLRAMLTHGYWQRRFGVRTTWSASNSSSTAGRLK